MVWWLAMFVPPASAQPSTDLDESRWWHGQPVAGVALVVTSGGLPDENLQPLLEAAQGVALTPSSVRADLVTLYRIGGFSTVEARVEPWLTDDAGNTTVWLTYRIAPAPVLAQVTVQGAGRGPLRRRALLDASGLAPGQGFYVDVDQAIVVERIERWLERHGYPAPTISLRSSEPEPGRIHLVITVDPGPAKIVSKVAFAGDWERTGVSEPQLRRWVAQAGVRHGKPLGPDSVRDARDRIRERLGNLRKGLIRPARGFVEARVTPVVVPDVDGTHVTFSIEPREQLVLDVDGLGPRGRATVLDALAIDHRQRLTGGFLDEAPDRVVRWLKERGWYQAAVDVKLVDDDATETRVLQVRARRRGRHTIGAPTFLLFFDDLVDLDVTYLDPLGEDERKRLSRAVQAVFDQASPEVTRRDHYTEAAMETGRAAAERMFAGRGHLAAEVEVLDPAIRPRRTLGNTARRLLGVPLHQRVDPQVRVSLGPVTTLSSLTVEGAHEEVQMPWLSDVLARAEGGPFSPSRGEALSRLVVDAHRAAGFIDADATVVHREVGSLGKATTITVVPGPKVLLRSIVIRNRRITRRELVERTVDLDIGSPIRPIQAPRAASRIDRVAPRTLDAVRRDLVGLGVFRTVGLEVLGDGPSRDLVITVNERPRTAIEVGGGVSTDQGVRTFVRGNRINLFGTAHRIQALAQLGLDYRSDNARNWLPDVTSPEGRAALSYTAPRFPSARQQLAVDVTFRERRQERTLRIDSSGVGASLQARLGRRAKTALTAGLRVEARQLNQYDPPAVLAGEPWFSLIDPEAGTPSAWRTQEAVTALLLHDRRDDPLRPTRGVLVSLAGEVAPGIRWNDAPRTSFVKAEARASALIPVGPLTLRLVGAGGRIWPIGDGIPPVEDRFRLGGTGSLRGFLRDGVGPHARADRTPADWPGGIGPLIEFGTRDDPDRWVPTGGDTVANGTLELIAPLGALGVAGWEGYAVTGFVDVGNVWFVDPDVQLAGADDIELLPVRIGVGLGARVDTPVGPLQVDVALNPQAAFSRAGTTARAIRDEWEEPPARVHLTLGALF